MSRSPVEPDGSPEGRAGASAPETAPSAGGPVPARPGAALWFTGLPGSGKTTLAVAVARVLAGRGVACERLSMDEARRRYHPHPDYSDRERREAYALFVREAADLVVRGRLVLMDATAPELAMRRAARRLIERFAEVHLKCPLATAMRREAERPQGQVMAGLYAKAVRRKATGEEVPGLGRVIGVDVPFEEDPAAELTLDVGRLGVEEARDRVLERFAGWWGR